MVINVLENPVLVAHGGTGVQTLAANGVLYGNGTGAVLVTAQGPANSVLTANAGAPSFSANPTVTSLATLNGSLSVTGTVTDNPLINLSPNLSLSGTGFILLCQTQILPTAAGITIYGLLFLPTIAGSTANNIAEVTGVLMRIDTGANYTGTITDVNVLHVADSLKGGTAVITNQYGLVVEDLTVGATLNYGILSRMSVGTGKYGLYFSGSAANYIAGALGVGPSLTSPTAYLHLAAGTATASTAPLKFTSGTNLTAAEAGAVEYDGAALYGTIDTTQGRAFSDHWRYFRLTGSGSGITSIADFFGTNDGIALVANGIYEIEWFCYFSQATAGTATWTITTATTALANLTGEYVGSPIAGIGAVGTPQTAAINVTTSSATAFPVTGTEANAATHYFKIRALLTAGNGASNTRLRLTMSAGTATPLINSYFRVRRMSGANVGLFVA